MTDQPTRSRDKRPTIYAGMFAVCAAVLGVGVVGVFLYPTLRGFGYASLFEANRDALCVVVEQGTREGAVRLILGEQESCRTRSVPEHVRFAGARECFVQIDDEQAEDLWQALVQGGAFEMPALLESEPTLAHGWTRISMDSGENQLSVMGLFGGVNGERLLELRQGILRVVEQDRGIDESSPMPSLDQLPCLQVSPPSAAAAPEPLGECGKPGEEGQRVVNVLFEAPSSLDPEEQRERLERIATRFGGSAGQVVLLEGGGFEIPIAVPSESCPALLEALFQ